MLPDDRPPVMERLTAPVAVEPESVQQRFLIGKDEFLLHLRRNPQRLLAFTEPPHIPAPRRAGKAFDR